MKNPALFLSTTALCAVLLAGFAGAVNDGETIAWFSLDEGFVPIDGPANIYVAECVEAGVSSYSFNSYADPPKAKFMKARTIGSTMGILR